MREESTTVIDRHHVLFEHSTYRSNQWGNRLRGIPSLIPKLDRDAHEALHRDCPSVPMLGHQALARTVQCFEPTGNTFTDIDRLQGALERATRGSHDIERGLAELAVMAIDLQKPYIKEGIWKTSQAL